MGPSQLHSLHYLGASATPQQRVVHVLVNRLKHKLPCNSGVSLDRLEADTATQQAIETLAELSHDSLDVIAWALSELLERLAKQTDPAGLLSIEVLQSQLFVLKVLSTTMAARWSNHSRSSSRSSNNHFTSPDSPPMAAPGKRSRQPSSDHSVPPPTFQDPQPLDDSCAKYVLSVMVLYLRQTSSPEFPLMLPNRFSDLSFQNFDLVNEVGGTSDSLTVATPPSEISGSHASALRNQASSSSVRSAKNSVATSTIQIPPTKTMYEKTHMSLVKSALPVNDLIAKYAARIIFHLSASNWSSVYNRLRTKIHFLASNSSENPDVTDLQLMAHLALDKQRLVQLLNELSSLLVSMNRESQIAIAVPLRSAVWSWIITFPLEFNEAIRVRGRTEGAPERVFDLLYAMNLTSEERIFWPTLTILNCVSPERMSEFHSGPTKTSRKELKFGEDILKHATGGSKLSEVALVCLLDVCRAATYVKPEGEVPLRMVAFDIAHEIKSILSSSHTPKPFWESSDAIDVAMYAEALVVMYRFLSVEDALPLFVVCVEPERSAAVKTCAVRACLTLAEEASRIKWQKPLDKLEDAMRVRFRNIFHSVGRRRPEVDQYGAMKRPATHPKAMRTSPQTLPDHEVLLLGILSLWRVHSPFHFKDMTEQEVEEWIIAANSVWDGSADVMVKLSGTGTFRAVTEIPFAAISTDMAPPDTFKFVKAAIPTALVCTVMHVLNTRADVDAQRIWVGFAYQQVELFVKKTESPALREIQLNPKRVPGFILAEIGFLVSLTSADSHVSHLAAKGLRLLSHAERQPDAPVNKAVTDEVRSKRNPIYEQLGDPKVMIVGRVGHQKRIRKLVRLISYPSAVHVAVWEECYWRWRALSEIPFDGVNDNADVAESSRPLVWQEDDRFHWQNLTLFLAALGGACVQENVDLTSLANAIPAHALPDKMRVIQNPVPLVTTFITDLTNLLVSPDTNVRDVARDALGAELSPRLYSKLLKHLDETIRNIEDGAGQGLTERYRLLFLDQFIAVLKLLVENTQATLEDVIAIDISPTMLTLASFMARFHDSESFRLKIKFCVMCDNVCDRTDTLTLRKDSCARHRILDMVMDWIQPTAGSDVDQAEIQAELNMACIRTAVKLLDRLQLRSVDISNTGDDSVHVLSRLFNRYSGVLLQGLEACRIENLTSDSVSDIGSTHKKKRDSQREAELRELVIMGLAHLVSANTESGFKQCLPLAYDQDKRKRTIFAHVFARVLSQGTKFDPEDRSATLVRHTRLSELVKGSEMVLALTICEICPPSEVEMMISVLLNVFDTRASLLSLIKAMIEREVSHTDTEANLFRSNSTCTRFLSAFAKIHGYNYLRDLVQPLIKTMVDMPPGHGYELDPGKVGEDVATSNQRNVEIVATSFLKIVTSSVPAIPGMFREICAHIAKTVVGVWPESKFAATGAFIFLRFISPAVVSPETVDVEVPDDNITIRRGLMVVAKIIQNLANNIFFGKEAHMVALNPFLKENISNVTRFLSEISKLPPTSTTADDENDQWLGTTSDDTDLIVLHRFFDKHADKIGKELLSLSKPSGEGDPSAINGKRAWDGLCALLVDLGSPLEVPRPSSLPCSDHKEYLDLMARYARRDTASVEEIFLETAVPPGQPAVFVFQLSKVDVEALDIHLLMFHILKTLNLPAYQDRSFDVIVDCTLFTSISEVPLQWLKYCAQLIPSDIRSRFATTHILNPNALTQKYLRRLYNVTAGTPFCGAVRAYSSVVELIEHVSDTVLSQLVYPVTLEQEPNEEFPLVRMKSPQLRPIILEVGTTHLRITSIKTQPISPGLSCKATEIIPLADISDIYNVSTGIEHEFIIRRTRHGVTVYFSSPSREAIVKTIRSAKGRLKEVPIPLTERFSRFSNVPATLLHIGLLSVDLYDEELRGAAYDLLGAVCAYLNYDKSPIVAPKAGFIPGDPSEFVVQLSGRIADFAPELTLDFISEVSAAMAGMAKDSQRIGCIHYMSPWIKNLSVFSNATSPHFERSESRLRDCIRTISELCVKYPDIASTIQKYIWGEVGNLDSVIMDVILDELIRSATDSGIETDRCEAIANIISSLSSISVRGRIYSKLRKALSKTYQTISNSLTDHPNWHEISTLIRLALFAGPSSAHPTSNQLYVPEIIHLVTIVAGFGPALVRKSVYGIIMNLLQSLYVSQTEGCRIRLLQLITECTQPATLCLFGLRRETPTSEYTNIDPANDKDALETQEHLVGFLVQILEVTSGSKGLLNVWRARWMSLVTSTAFQVSPAVQTRSFVVLGTLATTDVDDDFLYQILVAFNTALGKANETHTMSVVSMLRCMCKIVPALTESSRYVPLLFWLAVSLLQASHFAFYVESTRLVRVTLETMEQRGMFKKEGVQSVLLESRIQLEQITSQLDDILKISFESSFSFSLASIIFKGIRHSGLKDSAEAVLRSLLSVAVRSQANDDLPSGFRDSISADALGYFLALLPLSTTHPSYRRLLDDCNIDDAWLPDAGLESIDEDEYGTPRISPAFLGINDSSTALLVTTFVGTMLTTAQGDDKETEILCSLLSDIASYFPQTVAMAYEGLQDRIKDTFANSANASIIRSMSNIFRVALQENSRLGMLRNSASTLTEDVASGPSRTHLNALDELGLQGLASNFQFLPPNRGHATKMINWIPALVTLIIA